MTCVSMIAVYGQCEFQITGQWSTPAADEFTASLGPTLVRIQFTTPGLTSVSDVSTTTRLTDLDPSWYSQNASDNPSLQLRLNWDTTRGPVEQDIDNPGDDKDTSTFIITFSEPVLSPIIHFDRLGGAGANNGTVGFSNSAEFRVLTPGITLSQPAGTGTQDFNVTSTKIFKTPDVPGTNATPATGLNASDDIISGTAAGSVILNSTTPITMVEFEWTGIGVEGTGGDELEIAISGIPGCMPNIELEKSIANIRGLNTGLYEVDFLMKLTNSGDTTLTNISLMDDISEQYGCGFQGIVVMPTVSMINTSGISQIPSINPNYNAGSNGNLLLGSDGLLYPGDEIYVELTILVDPNCEGVDSPLENQAFIEGTDPFGGTVVDLSDDPNDPTDIDILGNENPDDPTLLEIPRIELMKMADDSNLSTPVSPGDIIIYTFNVCNTGNVNLLNISIDDPLPGIIVNGTLSSLSIGQCNETAFTAEYTLQTADLIAGGVMNSAIVTGQTPDGTMITDTSDDPSDDSNTDPDNDGDPDDPTFVEILPEGIIGLTKNVLIVVAPDLLSQGTQVGDIFTYTFEVCNLGSLPLSNIMVTDPLLTIQGDPISLGLTECNSTNFTGVYSITQDDIDNGEVLNTAIVTGTGPNDEVVTNSSTEEAPINIRESISLLKSAITADLPNPSSVGDVIPYNFEVCNTGNVTLTNVSVTDPLVTVTGIPITLAPGECNQTSFNGSYTITIADINNGMVQNSATTSANTPDGDSISDVSDDEEDPSLGPDDPTVVILNPCTFASFSLESPDPVCLTEGQSILVVADVNQTSIQSGDIDIRYLLISNDGVIVDIAEVPVFNINSADQYRIVILQAELTDPTSGNYVDPSLIILGTNLLSDLEEFILDNNICGRIDDGNTIVSVLAAPIIELESNVKICNSGDLGMPFTLNFTDLILSDATVGDWSLSENTPIPENTNSSIPDAGSGLIPSSILDFTGVTPGVYTFNYVTTSAEAPCTNDSASIEIEVIDCESKCDELICNSLLQLSLGTSCDLVLNADQLLESPAIGLYRIELYNEDESYYGNDTVRADAAGQTLLYKVMCGENSCWGKLIVETNILPDIQSPCACQSDGSIPDECKLWCGDESAIADVLVSPKEAQRQYGLCGPELIGDIYVRTTSTGEICDDIGEVWTVTYSGKVMQHGLIKEVDILCQKYAQLKFNIDVDESDFNASFGFPNSVVLNCDYIDVLHKNEEGIEYEFGSPESIEAATDSSSLGYPFYINRHILIQDSVLVPDTQLVIVGQQIVDSLVMVDLDEDGIDEWELIQFAVKEYDSIFSEVLTPTGLAINPKIPIKNRACNLLVSYSDVEFTSCGQGTKIARTWTMVDWCDADIQRSSTQTIEVKDISAPEAIEIVNEKPFVISKLAEKTIGIDPWTCTGIFRLPEISLRDNCAESVEVVWNTDEGVIRDGYVLDIWLEQSPILLTATLFDECLNSSDVTMILNIIDDVPPVPVADDRLSVSLSYGIPGEEATAKIYASDVDEGSHDSDCGEVILKIVRMEDWTFPAETCDGTFVGYEPLSCQPEVTLIDLGYDDAKSNCTYDSINIEGVVTEAADFIKLCCEDVGSEVMAILFVIDKAGNRNQAMVSIIVNDQSIPTLFCEDSDFGCDEDRAELDELIEESAPEIVGGACENQTLEPLIASQTFKSESCGAGLVTIEWFLDVDGSGDPTFGDPFCTQFIEIESDGETLDASTIKWPRHYTGETYEGINIECDSTGTIVSREATIMMAEPFVCSPDLSDEIGPQWCYSDCGIVGVSSEIDTLRTGAECFKLIRRWTVIDWCIWDANASSTSDSEISENADTESDDEEDSDVDLDSDVDDGTSGGFNGVLISDNGADHLLTTKEKQIQKKKSRISDSDTFIAVEDWAQGTCSDCSTDNLPAIDDPVYFKLDEYEEDGYYVFDQVIKVIDDNAPIIVAPDTLIIDVVNGAISKDDQSGCFAAADVRANAFDFCNFNRSSNLLSWSASITDQDGKLLSDLILIEHFDNSIASVTSTVSQDQIDDGREIVIDGPVDIESQQEGLIQFSELFDIDFNPERILLTYNPSSAIDSLTELEVEENIYRLYFDLIDLNINDISINSNSDVMPEFEQLSVMGVFFVEFGSIEELEVGFKIQIDIDTDVTQVVKTSSGVGAPGDIHTIVWTVTDNCGNRASETTIVLFEDNRAPSPLCVSAVTTAYMETDGSVTVWATDFDFGSFDNCTNPEDLRYSIVQSGEDPLHPSDEEFLSQFSIELNCGADGNFYELDVWLWDQNGNGEFCAVSVLVSDENEYCGDQPESAAINGSIKSENDINFPEATVIIEAALTEYPKEKITNDSGQYSFTQNPLNQNYLIKPSYVDMMLNGVSTLDLVHIQRHILSLASLDSPYKVLAADFNRDQSVTAADIVKLRQIIIGLVVDSPSIESWMFVKKDQSFFDQLAPWPYIEDISIVNLLSSITDQDFVAIKVGDVDGSAAVNGLNPAEIRRGQNLELYTADASVSAGAVIRVPIRLQKESDLKGFQFSLLHHGLELISIESSSIHIDESNYYTKESILNISWNDILSFPIKDEIISLNFRVNKTGRLSDLISLNPSGLGSEAYTGDHFEVHDLSLSFDQGDSADLVELYQNRPNPFSDKTIIEFSLPRGDHAELRVIDHTGRVIITNKKHYPAGLHQVSLSKEEMYNSHGIFYYQIITSQANLTKKMILTN